jgi:hypothetical protein
LVAAVQSAGTMNRQDLAFWLSIAWLLGLGGVCMWVFLRLI